MWNKIRPLLVIVSIAINVAFLGAWFVAAAGHSPSRPADRTFQETVLKECALHRQLGLTDPQWGKLEPVLKQFRAASRDLAREIHQHRHDLLDLLSAPQPDRKAIDAKQQQVLAGQGRMQQLVVGQVLAEREILTPTQQQRLFSLIHAEMRYTDSCPMMGLGQAGGKGIGQALRKDTEH
jgi:Spy/CpxP family protein refolding chaperone